MSIPLDVLVRAVAALEAARTCPGGSIPENIWKPCMYSSNELGGYVNAILRAQKAEVAA